MEDPNFHGILIGPIAQALLGRDDLKPRLNAITLHSCEGNWTKFLSHRIEVLSHQEERTAEFYHNLYLVADAAFNSFLQANVTGPPLAWNPAEVIFPSSIFDGTDTFVDRLQRQLVSSLSVDGEAVYQLIPNVELFCLAKFILNHVEHAENVRHWWARMRVNFWHQKLLDQNSSRLQQAIYSDLERLERPLLAGDFIAFEGGNLASFLLERANIHLQHGLDDRAKADIDRAARERAFDFALTGRLGKRTKFQEKELSQLVVLAQTAEQQEKSETRELVPTTHLASKTTGQVDSRVLEPLNLNLNDDTLLESISFSKPSDSASGSQQDERLPASLMSLDPGNQPLLQPLDAIILLATASSVTNTAPSDGLTREETLPYAERVISGGSSNWQVYTQALLIRSRIEGYRTRTIERGVLQLQAVVDQVMAETTPSKSFKASSAPALEDTTTSFLPQPRQSESAPVSERLLYIHQLASVPRWKLEAELANRWVSLGGLRTALEIYERLQMWAEVALCWAANDREDKARKIIRRQLYNPVITTSTDKLLEDNEDNDVGGYRIERDPLPTDAPRLFCILGDLEKSTSAYERAWQLSNYRFSRAQRSLGKYYTAFNDLPKADDAYSKSLRIDPQNHPTWFALGSVRLLLENWAGAVDAFGRAVQIEDTDAESWSNLAVGLLKLPPGRALSQTNGSTGGAEAAKNGETAAVDPQKHIREAFVALKRAANLKRESYRIWQNLLTVSIRLSPPPYTDIVIAQTRLIDLLGTSEGEKAIDIDIVEVLVSNLVTQSTSNQLESDDASKGQQPRKTGLERMIADLIQKKITPLITSSRRLWLVTAKLSLHLRHPAATLSAYEKAWRVTLNKPGWDTGNGTEDAGRIWRDVVESTVDLVDAYESLGEQPKEAGMGEGEFVCKDWKFKARSAVRSVLARAKAGWEGDGGFETLDEKLQELKQT
ncbi:hypothetical protein MMC28_001416 [Mycoblastus sanguinarius]|nr:hypothetical protein [Mycoblastus sanguinarius]